MESTIDASGKIEIPRAIMEKLHLAPGMPLTIQTAGDRIVLLPPCNHPDLKYVNGGLVYTGKVDFTSDDPVAEMRKERDELLMKGLNGESENDE